MKIFNNIKSNIKAIIFDFDGTLLDSEPNYYLADKMHLKKYGIELTLEMKNEYIGIGDYNFARDMKEKFDLEKSIEDLIDEKKNIYLEIALNNINWFSNMIELVRLFYKNNYPMAVASGSDKDVLLKLLEKSNIKKYFNYIISSNEVERGKPFPDVFLKAANLLDISPENILVFEDSRYGVQAAKSAGMSCIAVPEKNYILTDEYKEANIVFDEGIDKLNPNYLIDMLMRD